MRYDLRRTKLKLYRTRLEFEEGIEGLNNDIEFLSAKPTAIGHTPPIVLDSHPNATGRQSSHNFSRPSIGVRQRFVG
jgi:hypothetical protein